MRIVILEIIANIGADHEPTQDELQFIKDTIETEMDNFDPYMGELGQLIVHNFEIKNIEIK
jgi:hypothetical protein